MALLSVAVVVTATLADAVPLSQTVRWLEQVIENLLEQSGVCQE
jgi:hypothetical protein